MAPALPHFTSRLTLSGSPLLRSCARPLSEIEAQGFELDGEGPPLEADVLRRADPAGGEIQDRLDACPDEGFRHGLRRLGWHGHDRELQVARLGLPGALAEGRGGARVGPTAQL